MANNLYREAIDRFKNLLELARSSELQEPNSVTLATSYADGRVSARTVLLKGVDERGFVFYTNLTSRKGKQLKDNPRAAFCFFWQPMWEQVLVEGRAEEIDPAEADAYWATRPRLSQLGAWASLQSQPLGSREELEQRLAEVETRFAGQPVPRPPHWSGYRVVPDMIEFWTARPGRLHDRLRYELDGERWIRRLINP